ncbi:MAG: AAA family ATPase [Candidatus Poribacteria bacterium]|jgi:predicted kinase|nr:AAA family ATPase [Candidatus Poribacteria bacterium]
MRTLYIVRGLPGSGKSTLGNVLCPGRSFAADDYFEKIAEEQSKSYSEVFCGTKLGEAHAQCADNVKNAMESGDNDVAVCNTFSQKWEAESYFALAQLHGWEVMIVECQSVFDNTHDVPYKSIMDMRKRWEPLLGRKYRLHYLKQQQHRYFGRI